MDQPKAKPDRKQQRLVTGLCSEDGGSITCGCHHIPRRLYEPISSMTTPNIARG